MAEILDSFVNHIRDRLFCREMSRAVVCRGFWILVCLFVSIARVHASDERLIEFNISQQRVDTALIQFAEQADLTLIVPFDQIDGMQANPLYGLFSIPDGIERLLSKTGFEPDLGELGKRVIVVTNSTERSNAVKDNNKELERNKCAVKRGWLNKLVVGVLAAGSGQQVVCAQDLENHSSTLEEIVVTAQKRKQNLQDVPITIATLSSEEITTLGVSGDDIRMLAARVPNLTIESTFGRSNPRFFIRGQGNGDFRLNATQPVATYYDEVILENPALRGMPIFDLERIEILSGPQGSLWGKNTTGGAIHLISKKPTEELEGYGRATAGSFGTFNLEGAVGGALTDNLSGRLSLLSQTRDGWVRNAVTGNDLDEYDDFAFRGQLLWTPNDNLEALFRVHGRRLDGTSTLFNANANTALDKENIALESDDTNQQDVDQQGFSANISYDFGGLTLTSITAFESGELFSRGDLDGSAVADNSQVNFTDLDDLDQFTQEIRLASDGSDSFNWQAGFFYYKDDMHYTDTGSNLRSFGNHLDVNFDSQSTAVFGQISNDFSDKLNLTAGLRYTKDEKHLDHRLFFFGPNPADPLNPFNPAFVLPFFIGPETADIDRDWSETTGDISLSYQASDSVNLFGRIAKGFRSGTIDGNSAFADPVGIAEPETVISYELGMKSDLLDGRMRLNASAFSYDYEDQQVFSFSGVNNGVILGNAVGGTGLGFELDMQYLITDNLKVSLGYGYLDTEYDGPTLVTNAFTNSLVDIDGNPFPNAPENTANLIIDYSHPLQNGSEVYFSTDWSYRSEVNFATYAAPLLVSSSYAEGSFRLGYKTADDKYDFAFWGRNITDVEELTGFTTFTRVGIYTGPRTFGIDFIAKF